MVTAVQRQFWIDSAISCHDYSASAFRVAMAVGQAVYIGQASCFLSYDTLASKTGLHRVTVVRAIKELQQAGWVSVMRTRGRRSNTYALSLPAPLHFPDEETRHLADIAQNNAANMRESDTDKIEQTGKFAALPAVNNGGQDEAEQLSCCATVGEHFEAANSSVTELQLSGEGQLPNYATDADRQQLQNAAPTVVKLGYPIIEKKKKPYSPLDAQPTTDGVSCNPSGASSKQPAKAPTLVFVEYGTTAATAWERHWLKTRRVRPNWRCMPERGFKRGWYFPTEFPPEDTT